MYLFQKLIIGDKFYKKRFYMWALETNNRKGIFGDQHFQTHTHALLLDGISWNCKSRGHRKPTTKKGDVIINHRLTMLKLGDLLPMLF